MYRTTSIGVHRWGADVKCSLFYVLSNLRRQRGYSWEQKMIEKFTDLKFNSVRLGGTTTSMPDVSAHKDDSSLIISIECKSGISNSLIVPKKQLLRCMDWCKTWGLYQNKIVILAFKFARKDVKGNNRKGRQYLKTWNWKFTPADVKCGYDGNVFLKYDDTWKKIELTEFNICTDVIIKCPECDSVYPYHNSECSEVAYHPCQ